MMPGSGEIVPIKVEIYESFSSAQQKLPTSSTKNTDLLIGSGMAFLQTKNFISQIFGGSTGTAKMITVPLKYTDPRQASVGGNAKTYNVGTCQLNVEFAPSQAKQG